jgi:hypothetical protein
MFLFENTLEAASSHLLGNTQITLCLVLHWGPLNEIMENVIDRLKGSNGQSPKLLFIKLCL